MKGGMHFLDDEKLIEAVKCRPFMYDVDDPQHNSRQMLFKSWREIAQEVGQEVHIVKERWISMRDYYRKKLRELEKIKSGQLDKKFKKWTLYDKLDFLRPFLRHIEIDTTSTPEVDNSQVEDIRNDSDIDSEEEGVQLGIGIVKAENTDEDEDENQSDDSYRRDVVQALDSGYGSLDMPNTRKKSRKTPNRSNNNNTIHVRRRPAYLDADEASIPATSNKRQRLEWAHPAASVNMPKPGKLTPASAGGLSVDTNTNHQFFASLIPMIETLDSLTAMEFRHEVHGLLLNYLKQEREKKKAEKENNSSPKTSEDARSTVCDTNKESEADINSNQVIENGVS